MWKKEGKKKELSRGARDQKTRGFFPCSHVEIFLIFQIPSAHAAAKAAKKSKKFVVPGTWYVRH
jgi:hypothetical protein